MRGRRTLRRPRSVYEMNIWAFIYRFACVTLAILLLVGIGAMFYPKFRQHRELQRQAARLAEEIRFDQEMVQHLKTKQEKLQNDPRFLERVAREELGLAKPGETVFKFIEDSPTNNRTRNR